MEGRVIILSHLLNAVNSSVSWIWSGLEEYVSIYVTITYVGKMWLKYRYIGFHSNIGLSKLYVMPQPTNISVTVNFSNLV